ncbi:MAG: 16S rRNA (adenine(1518)-N(6)/adenine(1519)-N(6))-dimethyltransferase RsmA [Lachnospiraceae bacterium]|jgi:16S rRNA (adenine1518-N6/adenine1519-N6)-dimethyltransferase|nr:16S rRNA (adenine(1518)-N(6)/adenine(1519)-N(6))-dimethyltransferase RsmA [Lachnospiraceae bacterium]MCI6330631.1 16S rRNA (adenine(1518)-N(6)/adenine(1519)-N(6))-dimethyltransferase RsmA [Lachnospiraceae bacterium]MCI6408803.1 16S rRNA (adenine(1518)-N(6)/adenine(1519)-N(6))-dimethyltransferase RsmA [Lachnospiraceae bacterium]MCI6665152.1 16S rRNA (adenine(1518)-N(6)/adenine(1519)-N(6))-dimethyltransferase RsmA [Lachnospiraceae bacterium]MDD7224307.1 16S rRNA (adenine(1518)-N(6)/adenine(151
MSELSNFKNTQEIIKKHNFSIQKKYGQNFLIDEHVLNKIIAAAELTEDDYVIEIGPGIGTMTERMAPECRHVTAIEIDKELIPILSETLSGFDNVDIINEDVLKVDLNKLIAERNDNKPVKVVANLPYYITTPIIMSLLENKIPIDTITVMVQKEVADRMMVGPGTKDYGALSLAVQYYAKPYIVANVPMNCFIPRPNVASAVIRLTCHKEPPVTVKDEKLMFNLIRASFNQRRKTLINGISNFSGLSFTKEQVAMALNSIGLSENIRGEALDLEKFAKLSDALLET